MEFMLTLTTSFVVTIHLLAVSVIAAAINFKWEMRGIWLRTIWF